MYTKQKAKEYAETIIGKTVSPYLQGRIDTDGFWFLCERALFAALFLSFASEGSPEVQFVPRAKEILQAASKNPETLDEMFREEKADKAARDMYINYLYGSGKNAKRIISSCFSRADALFKVLKQSTEGKHIVHGYKGFDINMSCHGFQYEPGKTYEMDGVIEPCKRGFHFCPKMADVFNYYDEKGCRYAEVEAVGKVFEYGDKSVTNKIHIIRELTWAEVLEAMYVQAGLDLETSFFPADKIIQARGNGTLGEMLPSGTEFPVTFTNGERNVLVVCRDRDHTYLVTKYIMREKFVMNDDLTNKGGWPACRMREHVQDIYDMLPEDIRKAIISMHIRQTTQGKVVECDDPAFLLSAVNVFGKDAWDPEADCYDTQIDIFRNAEARMKKLPGASSASWWWLRSADDYGNFGNVFTDGSYGNSYAGGERGVAVGFCIEA